MIASQQRTRFQSFSTAAVLGAGAWGTALALALCRSGLAVRLWSRRCAHADAMQARRQNAERLEGHPFPPDLQPTSSLAEALDGADVALLATPSQSTVSLASAAARHARAQVPAIICAKGLGDRGALLSDCVQPVWKGPVLVLSGPSFADEVAQRFPTIVSLAGPMPFAVQLADRLSSDQFVLCPSADLIGVQVAAVFKNVAAILCGACDGVGLGSNARAALMSEAVREAAQVIEGLGGSTDTLLGPAGFGDFALTCTDAKSRNYRFGRRLGRGAVTDTAKDTREGVANVSNLLRLARRLGMETPLAAALCDMLGGRQTPREAVEAAFSWRRNRATEAARAA